MLVQSYLCDLSGSVLFSVYIFFYFCHILIHKYVLIHFSTLKYFITLHYALHYIIFYVYITFYVLKYISILIHFNTQIFFPILMRTFNEHIQSITFLRFFIDLGWFGSLNGLQHLNENMVKFCSPWLSVISLLLRTFFMLNVP